jgi:hypothetical protein
MENTSEKYLVSLTNAIKSIKVADHILYITYPLMKEKRLLLKALDCLYESTNLIISSILQYEYIWKRIILIQDSKVNFQTFIDKCTKRYNITEQEINDLNNLIQTVENHKKSPLEFLRKDKIIIMSDSLKTRTIDSEALKTYLKLSKSLFQKARNVLQPV